jgi:hypothetical protein
MVTINEFIRLGLTSDLLKQVRAEAGSQKISVNALIRGALTKYLRELKEIRIAAAYAADRPIRRK